MREGVGEVTEERLRRLLSEKGIALREGEAALVLPTARFLARAADLIRDAGP